MAEQMVVVVETEPDAINIRLLEERLYEFNVEATGIADGKSFGLFLREPSGTMIGVAYGWTWGGTCHLRYLFVPADRRNQGHGTRLMQAVEDEARLRRCGQIVVETHDFQAPGFYRKLGFDVTGVVEGYPRGHRYLTLVEPLPGAEPQDRSQSTIVRPSIAAVAGSTRRTRANLAVSVAMAT
jgi:ribosomal protein S18 acetylase RimI-like enzyme